MEWVETTGKTIEEAKEAALDQLGVDEHDAEFDVLEEPKTGLFGRIRGDARVRARVRPTTPRPKVERRDRKGRGRGPRQRQDRHERGGNEGTADHDEERAKMTEDDVVAHGEVVRDFLLDLLDAFGLDGQVVVTPAEPGAVELAVSGEDLGLLIGPKGQTLAAIQELARGYLQRQRPGETHARVRIDVGGYRQRRREALERFARQIAEEVRASGIQKALEPMSPPDRKVVHDTVNLIEGVTTISEGEEDRRRVVILPDV